jgi:hypothetical protein
MLLLNNASLLKAKEFINTNARPLDKAVFNYYFEGSSLDKVFSELEKYQNSDGGFGHGLEPDIRTPVSNNISTTYAFQYLYNISEFPEFMHKAVNYLAENFSDKYNKWLAVNPQVNDSPRAVWWNYEEAKQAENATWGNPTVEILGYLSKYPNSFDTGKLRDLKDKSIQRLLDSDELEFHELFCYARFIRYSGIKFAPEITDKLNKLILNSVQRDTAKWDSYGVRPLNFVDSPSSDLYSALSLEVDNELDYLINKQETDGSWIPNWEWYQYPEEWNIAKVELAGKITVDNLLKLRSFSRIQTS